MSPSEKLFQVSGHYGQISIEADKADLPEWVTGDESAVSTDTAVWIATRSDADGPTTVVLRHGIDPHPIHRVVFDGPLNAATPRLVIGSALARDTHVVDLPEPGMYRLRVSVGPPPVAQVFVELGPRVSGVTRG